MWNIMRGRLLIEIFFYRRFNRASRLSWLLNVTKARGKLLKLKIRYTISTTHERAFTCFRSFQCAAVTFGYHPPSTGLHKFSLSLSAAEKILCMRARWKMKIQTLYLYVYRKNLNKCDMCGARVMMRHANKKTKLARI